MFQFGGTWSLSGGDKPAVGMGLVVSRKRGGL